MYAYKIPTTKLSCNEARNSADSKAKRTFNFAKKWANWRLADCEWTNTICSGMKICALRTCCNKLKSIECCWVLITGNNTLKSSWTPIQFSASAAFDKLTSCQKFPQILTSHSNTSKMFSDFDYSDDSQTVPKKKYDKLLGKKRKLKEKVTALKAENARLEQELAAEQARHAAPAAPAPAVAPAPAAAAAPMKRRGRKPIFVKHGFQETDEEVVLEWEIALFFINNHCVDNIISFIRSNYANQPTRRWF